MLHRSRWWQRRLRLLRRTVAVIGAMIAITATAVVAAASVAAAWADDATVTTADVFGCCKHASAVAEIVAVMLALGGTAAAAAPSAPAGAPAMCS